MKTNLQKTLLTIACLLCSIAVYAHDFEVDGIYYNITSETGKTVEVTFRGDDYDSYNDKYTGTVVIPESVTYNGVNYTISSIGYYTFYKCAELTSITIPNSVTKIGKFAFEKSGLSSIIIPNSVISIEQDAFSDSKLQELIIEDGETTLSLSYDDYDDEDEGIGLFYWTNLKTLYIGRNLSYSSSKRAGYSPFASTSIKNVILGEKITSIGSYCFRECRDLTSITIPSSVTSIGDGAFEDCEGLTEIALKAINPPIIGSQQGYITFLGVDKSIPIYVPKGSVEAYKSAEYWNVFTNIIGRTYVTVLTIENNNVEMFIGEKLQLISHLSPDDATEKALLWSSDNPDVAFVDENGIVTAHQKGSARITATTTDASLLTASCVVTIKEEPVKLEIQNSYYSNIGLLLKKGTIQKIEIFTTDEVYKLNSVWCNGEEVTNEVVDGVYTTPVLEEDAYINISFIIPTGQQDAMSNSRIKAYGYKGDVVVVGCERGENIAIYDVDGVMLRSVYATSNTMRIAMPTDAVYVVRVSDMAVKVAL